MPGFAKLYSGITESSLWSGSKDTRILFITMLAKADSTCFVEASLSGLCRVANLTREEVESALSDLMSPDPDSKSDVLDGRRVVKVPKGFMIVNYEEYRNRRDEQERREYMREYMRTYRSSNEKCLNSVNSCKQGKLSLAKAEAEAETEAKPQLDAQACNAPSVTVTPSNAQQRNVTTRQRSRGLRISGVSENAKAIISSLGPIWHKKQPDGSRINSSNALWAGALDKIFAENPDLDVEMLVEGAKIYLSEQRKMFKAPQYYFGPEGYWLGYANIAFERANAKKREGGAE